MSTYSEMLYDPSTLPLRADALLAAQPRCPKSPFYTEDAMRVKCIRARSFARKLGMAPEHPACTEMLGREWAAILKLARLTSVEASVVRLYLGGASMESIAKRRGVSRQAIYTRFRGALEKIRDAYHVYPLAGMTETYVAELKKGFARPSYGTLRR